MTRVISRGLSPMCHLAETYLEPCQTSMMELLEVFLMFCFLFFINHIVTTCTAIIKHNTKSLLQKSMLQWS